MNSFFKIGLPWAISIGIVFFLGLKLGDSTRYISNETKQIQSSVGSKIEPEKRCFEKYKYIGTNSGRLSKIGEIC